MYCAHVCKSARRTTTWYFDVAIAAKKGRKGDKEGNEDGERRHGTCAVPSSVLSLFVCFVLFHRRQLDLFAVFSLKSFLAEVVLFPLIQTLPWYMRISAGPGSRIL